MHDPALKLSTALENKNLKISKDDWTILLSIKRWPWKSKQKLKFGTPKLGYQVVKSWAKWRFQLQHPSPMIKSRLFASPSLCQKGFQLGFNCGTLTSGYWWRWPQCPQDTVQRQSQMQIPGSHKTGGWDGNETGKNSSTMSGLTWPTPEGRKKHLQ